MKQSFSDVNVEISQILNGTMYEFDQMPGVSGSLLVESASRDIRHISAYTSIFLLGPLVVLAIVFWQIKGLSSLISSALAWIHITIAPATVVNVILASLFIACWGAFFIYLRNVKKRNFEMMTEAERGLVQAVRTLADALPENCGMLAQNLRELAQRMIKIFARQEPHLVSELMHSTKAVFSEKVCFALGLNSACNDAIKRLHESMSMQKAELKSNELINEYRDRLGNINKV
ncbi:hypothetical protein ACO0LL_17085 [Undibacterium sp. TC4M20W]|uniref:hypothetical protein n=1 Tax=unclassified Undibacterium TaxID=2630295 RepID=UPI003BF19819